MAIATMQRTTVNQQLLSQARRAALSRCLHPEDAAEARNQLDLIEMAIESGHKVELIERFCQQLISFVNMAELQYEQDQEAEASARYSSCAHMKGRGHGGQRNSMSHQRHGRRFQIEPEDGGWN